MFGSLRLRGSGCLERGEEHILGTTMFHQRHMSWEAQLGRVFRLHQPPLTAVQQIPAAGEGTELTALA